MQIARGQFVSVLNKTTAQLVPPHSTDQRSIARVEGHCAVYQGAGGEGGVCDGRELVVNEVFTVPWNSRQIIYQHCTEFVRTGLVVPLIPGVSE